MQTANSKNGETLFWRAKNLDGLELFRAKNTNYSYPKHSHNAYSIGTIETGMAINYCWGEKQYFGQNSLVLFNPEEVHTGYSADANSSYRMLYIDEKTFAKFLEEKQALPSFEKKLIYSPKWAKRIKQLHKSFELTDSSLFYEESIFLTIQELRREFAKHPLEPKKSEHVAVKTVKDFLEENYHQGISIDELAKLTNLNRAYLMRIFRKETALPIYSYLLQIRIKHAKNMLINGQDASNIALDLGFSDQSHFIRSFKRITGSTPGRFAKSHYRSRNIF